MRLNADFSQAAIVRPIDYVWVASPMPGVERMMLDRIGDEVARATSLVRYAPNTTFSPHVHGGGEEFFVLEGEFGDEHALYPVGTYVRNPIGTSHSPRVGADGCTIFVKLHQFEADDQRQFAVDTNQAEWQTVDGAAQLLLHEFGDECVRLIRLDAGMRYDGLARDGGEEFLVLEGSLWQEDDEYPAGSWVRNPDGMNSRFVAGSESALVYVKSGHLAGAITFPATG